eukprot:15412631-Alexandrium_andersonii.AAC.1
MMDGIRQTAEEIRAEDRRRRRAHEELAERAQSRLASFFRSDLDEAPCAGAQAQLEAVAAAQELAEEKEKESSRG